MVERMPAAGAGSGRARRCGFVVWRHGLGDCGRANEFIAEHFSAAAFRDTRWAFPTAPTAAVTCNRGALMPSWFDIHDAPITSARQICSSSIWLIQESIDPFCPLVSLLKSVRDEEDVPRAVQIVHTMIDREIAAGTNPEDVFVFGLSQGVFSGFLPFDSSSFAARVTDDAKKEGRDGVKFLRGLGMICEFKAYDRLGHTLAPYELEYCERWASENILSEHREEEGLKLNKGGLPGSKFFGGVFSCFSK
ncbi:hypothetical protein GQ55_7G325200 [Panicum hallii var. hallii]|uniref:Phospholipase/carboxylesterase/thioesterase domain-containing protein n=1 Tax=Panicum hallii var. hallii TaxID=1504633 RepID=A0A2T7D1K7_9POAL|nr:hypothetical protein GQ55_7G325200 [Panicum hallii var. hallii]